MTTEPAATCPSTFTLDRHLVGELTPQEACALDLHLAECAACQTRWAGLTRFNARFVESYPSVSSILKKRSGAAPPSLIVSRWKKVTQAGAVVSAVSALA